MRKKDAAFQESLYRKDFGNFSKRICDGKLDHPDTKPNFNKEAADVFFSNRYSIQTNIDVTRLNWFPFIHVDENEVTQFDVGPILPKHVKAVLLKKKSSSAPGPDGLLYGLLKNLPTVHHFLATMYTRMLLESQDPPDNWSNSKVVLIYKSGDPGSPENFRMISLTSCVSKIFHQILADRLVTYLTANKFIDDAVQKAFVKNVSGCIEHNQLLQETIMHAKS